MNAYSLADVVHGYGGKPVLTVPRLEIAAGAVTALVGPNGSGKSTLLHLLALLALPERGEIRLFGEPVTRRSVTRLRRDVSLLLQTPYLFHTSVARNVAWGLHGLGLGRAERRQRVMQSLQWVGLEALAARSAQGLSGGEGQRLALACLLARQPRVILLDEPTTHVDEATTGQIERVLTGWVREHDTTVVFATHDLDQAVRLDARLLQVAGATVGGTDSGT